MVGLKTVSVAQRLYRLLKLANYELQTKQKTLSVAYFKA